MNKRLYIGIVGLLVALIPIKAQGSTNSTFHVDIYPMDCVFEYVNNGTGQITFLTPEACGQQVIVADPDQSLQTQAPIALANPHAAEAPSAASPIVAPKEPPLFSWSPISGTIARMLGMPETTLVAAAGIGSLGLALALDWRFLRIVPRLFAALGTLLWRRN